MDVRLIGPEDEGDLVTLFASLRDMEHFHPHDLGPLGAHRVATYSGRDVYLIGIEDEPVAYGLLRGWDDGFAVPSLGIAVARFARGRGYGRTMLLALHEIARQHGAKRVRLRVHPANAVARSLYVSVGYREEGEERGQIVMVCDLVGGT